MTVNDVFFVLVAVVLATALLRGGREWHFVYTPPDERDRPRQHREGGVGEPDEESS
jgi:hypothetical protein